MWVITFPSVHYAMRAKKLLNDAGIPVALVPVPRQLSDSCNGLAAHVDVAQLAEAVDLLNRHHVLMVRPGVEVKSLY